MIRLINRAAKEIIGLTSSAAIKVSESARDKKLCLCIGAGITRNYVGDWNKLLNEIASMQMLDTLIKNGGCDYNQTLVDQYIDMLPQKSYFPTHADTDVLEKGEYWMYDKTDDSRYIDSTQEARWREIYFATQVKYAIQKRIDTILDGIPLEDYFLAHEKAKESTLEAVISLCICGNIRDVIIYNFDDIIDRLLLSAKIWKKYRKEQRPIQIFDNHSSEPIYTNYSSKHSFEKLEPINIHHVHGFLSNLANRIEPIIFSEDSYLRYQSSLLNLSNTRMLQLMSKSSMLCIGFSGTDSNFRLLCRTIRESRIRMHDDGYKNSIYLTRCYREVFDHYNLASVPSRKKKQYQDMCIAAFQTYVSAVNTYFDHLYQVQVLWYETFPKMAIGIRNMIK